MEHIDSILKERGNRYGDFNHHALIAQNLKRTMYSAPNWDSLDDTMKESLEMVQHKIARILNGDPFYKDSWTDCIGYIKLVEETLDE